MRPSITACFFCTAYAVALHLQQFATQALKMLFLSALSPLAHPINLRLCRSSFNFHIFKKLGITTVFGRWFEEELRQLKVSFLLGLE